MPSGVVKRVDEVRGYGLIRSGDGDVIFFHRSRLADGYQACIGDDVTFDIAPNWRTGKTMAINVAPVASPGASAQPQLIRP